MALEPTVKVVLGSVAFGIFWILAVFPAVPFMPIGRTAGSLLGAMLMVIFHVITADEAYAAIDLPILGLLFGTMVVSVYLERADMFRYLGKLLSWKSFGGKDLLCRICVVSALGSALFTNDTCCVVLTEFILKVARQNNLPPKPFLLALASSANIGSSATPIGNPQNLVIAVRSKIPFGRFLLGVLPAMLVGVFVNILFLLCVFWRQLSGDKNVPEVAAEAANDAGAEEEEVTSHRFMPATMSHSSQDSVDSIVVLQSSPETENAPAGARRVNEGTITRRVVKSGSRITGVPEVSPFQHPDDTELPMKAWKLVMWKSSVYVVTFGMLLALLLGFDMSWSAITAALALIVLDFKDACPSLDKVSYSLLIFFCGMFVSVDGFNKTGLPSSLWDFVEPYARIDSVRGMVILAVVITFLSNVASNVPTVLLLGARVAASAAAISHAKETKAWLALAWVSTVAGNLSLLGSAANLIVCEQARRSLHYSYNLSFFGHLRFGLPSTFLITAIGLLLIRGD